MPRYFTFVCEYCGKPARRPGISPPHFCSRACWHDALTEQLSNKIGEPLQSAVQRRYVLLRMSVREIAAELQINHRTVLRTLARFGIDARQGGEAIVTQWEDNPKRRAKQAEWLQTIARRRGPEHPRWRGGTHYAYCDKSWIIYAQEIRHRDGDRCTRCGRTSAENLQLCGKTLEVHHIIPLILSDDNSPENLRTLCINCHRHAEHEFIWVL